MDAAIHAADTFPHLRIVMGMVIGLGMTHVPMGVAAIVQHPHERIAIITAVPAPADNAAIATLADPGAIGYAADIAQLRHETLETRMFRS